jgi:hypothetical protein
VVVTGVVVVVGGAVVVVVGNIVVVEVEATVLLLLEVEVVGGIYVMVILSVPVLYAASYAVTVIMLLPSSRVIAAAAQLSVPIAVPAPPRLFTQVTSVTSRLSVAEPATATVLLEVINADEEVGTLIVTVGFWVSYGMPFISIDFVLSLFEVS